MAAFSGLRSRRGLVAVGIVIILGVLLTAFVTSAVLPDRSGEGGNFAARSRTELVGTFYETGVALGAVQPGPSQLALATTKQKVYARKGQKFEVDGSSRVVTLPAGTYDLYVKYQGEDGKDLLLRGCLRDLNYDAYCPTGTFLKLDEDTSLKDVSEQLLMTQTAPIGVTNRRMVELFDEFNKGQFWLEAEGAKLSTVRLYKR